MSHCSWALVFRRCRERLGCIFLLWLVHVQCSLQFCDLHLPGTVRRSIKLIFLWIMIMFMFFCILFYYRMYNYMYLCTNKAKNMTKITIRLFIPILQIHILWTAMSTNITQNWWEHCIYTIYWIVFMYSNFEQSFKHSYPLSIGWAESYCPMARSLS